MKTKKVQYRVTGMDCPSCAGKIEAAARKIPGVEQVKVSISSQTMTLATTDASHLPDVEQAVTSLGYKLAQVRPEADGEEDLSKDFQHASPAYRRALLIVVFLNVGYGLIEMIGGFMAASQSLKADALDFLGDGLIGFLGILAIGWPLIWRARAALLQGIFLGALGIGVAINIVYRAVVLHTPEAEIMGLLGLIALGVNVSATLVLMPHRSGDSNVRAVWLYSRNDAIGNLMVVIAAGLVIWTRTSWPDLISAGIIAALFLHSSWAIIKDARSDLKK